MYRFAQVIVKIDGTVTMEEVQALHLIWHLLHYEEPEELDDSLTDTISLPEESLEQVLSQFTELIGMQNIKDEVKTLTNFR